MSKPFQWLRDRMSAEARARSAAYTARLENDLLRVENAQLREWLTAANREAREARQQLEHRTLSMGAEIKRLRKELADERAKSRQPIATEWTSHVSAADDTAITWTVDGKDAIDMAERMLKEQK